MLPELNPSVTLTGTTNIAPNRFIGEKHEVIENADAIEPELVGLEEGYTYEITVQSIRSTTRHSDGSLSVTYRDPESDREIDRTTSKIPPGFEIVKVST